MNIAILLGSWLQRLFLDCQQSLHNNFRRVVGVYIDAGFDCFAQKRRFCVHSQVVPEGEHRALYGVHSFKVLFKEGGVGTFVPLFLNLIRTIRNLNVPPSAPDSSAPPFDPMPAEQQPVDDIIRHA